MGAAVSGVFYLRVPPGAGRLCFFDPRGSIPPFEREVRHVPQRGEVLLFPPWLSHAVGCSGAADDDGPRLSISFNYVDEELEGGRHGWGEATAGLDVVALEEGLGMEPWRDGLEGAEGRAGLEATATAAGSGAGSGGDGDSRERSSEEGGAQDEAARDGAVKLGASSADLGASSVKLLTQLRSELRHDALRQAVVRGATGPERSELRDLLADVVAESGQLLAELDRSTTAAEVLAEAGARAMEAEARATEERATEARAAEARAEEARATEARATEARAAKERAAEMFAVDMARVAEARAVDAARASEARATEERATEARAAEARATEVRAVDAARAAEARAVDERSASKRVPPKRVTSRREKKERLVKERAEAEAIKEAADTAARAVRSMDRVAAEAAAQVFADDVYDSFYGGAALVSKHLDRTRKSRRGRGCT